MPEAFETCFAEVGGCDDSHETVFVCWTVGRGVGFGESVGCQSSVEQSRE